MLREYNGILAYAVLYTLSMVTHVFLAMRFSRRRGLPIKYGIALGLCYVWSMNTGARMLYDIMTHRFNWLSYVDPGYYFEPGMWGGPLVYLVLAILGTLLLARDRRNMLDVVVLTLPVPMMLAKAACFVNGCCYGAVSSMPWAVTFPGGGTDRTAPAGVPLHPTQLYEILVLAVVLCVLSALDKKRWRGALPLWFVVLYGFGRPLAEFFRASDRMHIVVGPLTLAQAVCFAGALVAGVVLLGMRSRGMTGASRSPVN